MSYFWDEGYRKYVVRRQAKTRKWYVQFLGTELPNYYNLWRVISAKGGFNSPQEAEAWAQALIRLGEAP